MSPTKRGNRLGAVLIGLAALLLLALLGLDRCGVPVNDTLVSVIGGVGLLLLAPVVLWATGSFPRRKRRHYLDDEDKGGWNG